MNRLEKMLDESYDDLDTVDKMFDYVTQENKIRADYCIEKRKRICDRIQALKQEIELEKGYVKLEEPQPMNMAKFVLSNVAQIQKIDKILYKKETAVGKQFGF